MRVNIAERLVRCALNMPASSQEASDGGFESRSRSFFTYS